MTFFTYYREENIMWKKHFVGEDAAKTLFLFVIDTLIKVKNGMRQFLKGSKAKVFCIHVAVDGNHRNGVIQNSMLAYEWIKSINFCCDYAI